MRYFLATLLLGVAVVVPCRASGFLHRCPKCGCCEMKKACRMVPDVKKVTEYKYTVEEEEVCLLGKSCTEQQMVTDACAPGGNRCEKVQVPRCGMTVCKKKLKKTATTVEKPTVKCVLEVTCSQCGNCCDTGSCVQ